MHIYYATITQIVGIVVAVVIVVRFLSFKAINSDYRAYTEDLESALTFAVIDRDGARRELEEAKAEHADYVNGLSEKVQAERKAERDAKKANATAGPDIPPVHTFARGPWAMPHEYDIEITYAPEGKAHRHRDSKTVEAEHEELKAHEALCASYRLDEMDAAGYPEGIDE